ncbi:MAG: shikimate kinase / 3-dehydroquinate synthase [Verrucomicrobiota bacterium]|jgi:nucleoside-diphosphate-sugar epimerase
MARIVIAGCGYVGEAAADRFHDAEWEVEGWTATAESAARLSGKPFTVRAVDVTAAVVPGSFDVVIYCVSSRGGDEHEYRQLYFEGAKNLLRSFPDATLLFTSSTSVYAQIDGSRVDETSPAEPRQAKGRILRETEDLVLAAGGIVARLGGIHGPGRSFFLTRFLEGAISDEDDRLINQVHRDDVVSALQFLVDRRNEFRRQVFNVVGDEPITAREAVTWLSARVGKGPSATGGAVRAGKRGRTNKRVSNGKLRALGWAPRYPTFQAAMSESILPSFGF